MNKNKTLNFQQLLKLSSTNSAAMFSMHTMEAEKRKMHVFMNLNCHVLISYEYNRTIWTSVLPNFGVMLTQPAVRTVRNNSHMTPVNSKCDVTPAFLTRVFNAC